MFVQAKGGSFEGNDKDFLRLTLGVDKIVPGVQEAMIGMKPGGVRRIIIPDYLGYPDNDFKTYAPKPTTFAVRSLMLSLQCDSVRRHSLPHM